MLNKWKTLDCETCPLHVSDWFFIGEVCLWGVYPKKLCQSVWPDGRPRKMRHCTLDKNVPRNNQGPTEEE